MNKFKLPSLNYLANETIRTFLRFPSVLIVTVIGTFLGSYLFGISYTDNKEEEAFLLKIILTCILGLSLFLSVTLFTERFKLDVSKKLIINLLALLLLISYYFSLPEISESLFNTIFITRFVLYAISLHLLVAFVPFIGKNEINGFWEFNRALFQRILTSIVYSIVLYAGLSIALYSLNNLLEIKIDPKIYGHLWIFIVGIFNTCFFLAGIPHDIESLEKVKAYPNDLKIFTQYILLPLIIIYVIILYLYAGKIIINQEWPKGIVSGLIIGCSFTGILSLLLIFPLQNTSDKAWIRQFSRLFYIILLPLSIMLFFAVDRRTSDYGITENRYFLFIISFWLFGISLYFIFSKLKNIKVIPVSLCIIAFLISFGPWSAFNISQASQLNRLEKLLSTNKILINGVIEKKHPEISINDNHEISLIVEYLNSRGQIEKVTKWFKDDLKLTNSYDNSRKILEAMGLTYSPYWDRNDDNTGPNFYFSSVNNNEKTTDISGFNQLVKVNIYENILPFNFKIDSKEYSLINNKSSILKLTSKKEEIIDIDFKLLIDKLIKKYRSTSYQIPVKEMILDSENEKIKLRIIINSFQGDKIDYMKSGQIKIKNISAEMLLNIKTKTTLK